MRGGFLGNLRQLEVAGPLRQPGSVGLQACHLRAHFIWMLRLWESPDLLPASLLATDARYLRVLATC